MNISLRSRLILEVVIMVFRGTQFQRRGSAGCKFLTRQALSSCYAIFVPDSPLKSACRMESRSHGGDQCRQPHEGLAPMAREGDLCHGHIGELSLASQPWWS